MFDPKKLQPFITPALSTFIFACFVFPKLKMKLKGLNFANVAENREAVTVELKKVQQREIFGGFSEIVLRAKARIYVNGAYFE
jgi:hypothetical protein